MHFKNYNLVESHFYFFLYVWCDMCFFALFLLDCLIFFLIIGFLEPFYIFEISPLWCEIACMCCASIDIYVFQFVICPLAVTCSCSPHKMSWPNKMWTLILSALSLKSNVFELVLLPSWLRTYRWAQGRALQLRICRPQWTSSYRAAVSDPFVIFLGQGL